MLKYFFRQLTAKNQGRRLASLATLSGSVINTLIISIQAIILIPLYLQAIGPRLYGAWLGSGDFLMWIQAFDLGIPSLIIQRIGAAHGKGDLKTVGEYLAASMLALTLIACVMIAAAVGFSFVFPGLMGIVGSDVTVLRNCFIIAAIVAALSIANNSIVGFSRGIQETGLLNITLILAAVVGFITSLSLALMGWGLWAIALGMAARGLISLGGSFLFVLKHIRGEIGQFIRIKKSALREIIKISPVTTLGGLGYALMSQSESTLVAILLRPEMAVVMTLTRRAIDVARSIVDSIGTAAYGGFSHLVASSERHRTMRVHSEIHAFRLSMAISLAAAYMIVNASLIYVWVGPSQFGGAFLTILIAFQFIITGSSYLMNYLFRATGPVMKGSLMLVAECMVRLPLMVILVRLAGLPGSPIAALLTSLPFGWLAFRFTQQNVSSFCPDYPTSPKKIWILRSLILGLGIIAAFYVRRASWPFVILVGSAVALGSATVFILADPRLGSIRRQIGILIGRTAAPVEKGA